MSDTNGKKRVTVVAAAAAAGCSILSFAIGTYNGWTQRVEAAVIEQRMVNAHDETLKLLVPKVDACHTVNEVQQLMLDQDDRDIEGLKESVGRLSDAVQLYLQSQMRDGRIPR